MATTKSRKRASGGGPGLSDLLRRLSVWSADLANRNATTFTSHKLNGPPIKWVDGSVMRGADKNLWLWVNLPVFAPYDHLGADTKQDMQHQLTNLFRQLVGREFHLLTIPGRLNAQLLGEWWKQSESHHTLKDADQHAAYNDRIDTNVAALDAHQYALRIVRLGIRLTHSTPGKAAGFADLSEMRVFNLVNESNASLLPELRELLGKIHVAGFKDAMPLTTQELLEMTLWTAWAGHPSRPPVVLSNTDPNSSDHKLGYLADNNIIEQPRYLVIEPDDEDSGDETDHEKDQVHVAYLSLHRLPFDPICPLNEFLRGIGIFGEPIPMSIRGRVVPPSSMSRITSRRLGDAQSHRELVAGKNGAASLVRLDDEIESIRALDRHARAAPTVIFSATAVLTHPDLDTLKRMQTAFITEHANSYKGGQQDQGVGWIAGARTQLQRHHESLPGSPVRVDSYMHYASADSVAAGMPLVTSLPHSFGTYVGHLTGWGEAGPLFVDPAESLKGDVDTSTVILLMGPPGEGKTLAMTIFAIIMGLRGAVSLYRDPKGDLDLLDPPQGLRVDRIDMSNFPGGMSPALLGKTPMEGMKIMTEFLMTCAGRYDEDVWAAIYEAVKAEVLAHPNAPDFRNAIRTLAGGSEADRLIARRLTPVADLDQARAFWGTRDEADVLTYALRPGLTIWGTRGWEYPDHAETREDESRWTPAQRLTIGALELQFLLGNRVNNLRHIRTYTADDEFHLFGRLRVARAIRLAARYGRSYQSLVALATQGWEDLPPQIDTFVSLLLVFRQNTERDARIAAEALHLNPDDPGVISLIMHLGRDGGRKTPELLGECLIGRQGDVSQGRLDPHLWLGTGGLYTNTTRRSELGLQS